jgi:hypothetical protein
LALDERVQGYVADQAWNYYSYASNSMTPLQINVTQTAAGDCDIFVRANSKPTRFEFDYQDIGLSTSFSVNILQPGAATWWVGVFGFTPCEYQLQISIPNFPASQCQNGGTRPDPQAPCVCPRGFVGDYCQSRVNALAPSILAEGHATLNGWVYYTFEVSHTTSNIFFHLQETGPSDVSGEIWLFASHGSAPTIRNHEYADNRQNTKNHIINIQVTPSNPPRTQTLFVGVYGSPFLRRTQATYQLVGS